VTRASSTYIDSGASVSGTPDVSNLLHGSVRPAPKYIVHGSIGSSTALPSVQGLYGDLQLEMIVMKELNSTLLSVSAICDGGKDDRAHVCVFDSQGASVFWIR
jgi:hypothetical protein